MPIQVILKDLLLKKKISKDCLSIIYINSLKIVNNQMICWYNINKMIMLVIGKPKQEKNWSILSASCHTLIMGTSSKFSSTMCREEITRFCHASKKTLGWTVYLCREVSCITRVKYYYYYYFQYFSYSTNPSILHLAAAAL